MHKAFHLLIAISLLAGCAPQFNANANHPAKPSATADPQQRESNPNFGNVKLQFVIRGFSGKNPRFTSADAQQMKAHLVDGYDKDIEGISPVTPDEHGNVVFQKVTSGLYFASVTLGDGSVLKALVSTQRNDINIVSPGSTLATTWAQDQLDTKLVFLQELPMEELLRVAVQFDTYLEDNHQTLQSDTAARLAQLNQLLAANSGWQETLTVIGKSLSARSDVNASAPEPPASVSDDEFNAKRKKLGK